MTVATFRKNANEEVRVSVDVFHGHELVDLSVWYTADDGELRPGKQVLALRLELLPELRAALEAVVGDSPADVAEAAWWRWTPDEKREVWSRVLELRHSDEALKAVDRWNLDAHEDADDGTR